MDIYSSKKKARHAASAKRRSKNGKNTESVFVRIKKWFMKMPKKKRAIVISLMSLLLVLTIALGSVIGVFIWMTSDYNYNSEIDNNEEFQQIVPIDENIVNIALFGVDTRNTKSFKGLSDSIMILSVNKGTGDIKLISVMRDTLAEIPKDSGTVYNKINSAYSFGGASLAIKTLNLNFGLDIKEYATVNFTGMADIVDAVGGVEIDVLEKELNAKDGLNDCIRAQAEAAGIKNIQPLLVKKAGKQVLTGIQTVGWARIRAVSSAFGTANDYGRTDRQRYVMEQLLNKALAMKTTEYPSFIKKVLPFVETSLSYGEIIDLAKVFSKDIDFTQTRIPQSDYVITAPKIQGVGSTVYYNRDFAKDIIHSYIYDDISQEDYLNNNEIVKKGWYTGPTVSTKPSSSDTSSTTSSEIISSDINSSSDESSSDGTSSDETSSDQSSSDTSGSDSGDGSSDGSPSEESSEIGNSSEGSSNSGAA